MCDPITKRFFGLLPNTENFERILHRSINCSIPSGQKPTYHQQKLKLDLKSCFNNISTILTLRVEIKIVSPWGILKLKN